MADVAPLPPVRDARLPHIEGRGRALSFLSLILCLAAFLALGAHQINLPGLHYDEAKEAGLNAMQLITGQPVTAFRDAVLPLGRCRLPLMVQDYIGALNVYLAVPFLALGGINTVALRWLPLLTGALTLLLTWRVAGRLGGATAAAVAAALLAVNPTFVFWSRQGVFVTNVTAAIFMASLLTGLRWWQERRARDLWLTAFLFGLGVYAKLLFVWALVALVVLALLSWQLNRLVGREQRVSPTPGEALRRVPRCSDPRTWILATAFFLVPLTPLVLFNLQTGGTLLTVFGNLHRSYYGVNNAAFLPNLVVRLGQVRTLLRGDHFWYLGELFANQWAPGLAGALILLAGLRAIVCCTRREEQTGGIVVGGLSGLLTCRQSVFLLPAALLGLIVVQSAFTVSDLFITHYAVALPLIPLAGGLAAGALLREMRPSRGPLALLAALAALLAVLWWGAADLWTTARYHRLLSISGGYSAHSDAIYALAKYLDAGSPSAPLALDWGLDAPIRFLTVGRVNPVEVFGYDRLDEPDPGFAQRVGPFLENLNNLYVAHMPDSTVFRGRVDALKEAAAARGLALQEEIRFGERSGRPLFVLYRAVPAAVEK